MYTSSGNPVTSDKLGDERNKPGITTTSDPQELGHTAETATEAILAAEWWMPRGCWQIVSQIGNDAI